jgi:hypothetical protein
LSGIARDLPRGAHANEIQRAKREVVVFVRGLGLTPAGAQALDPEAEKGRLHDLYHGRDSDLFDTVFRT